MRFDAPACGYAAELGGQMDKKDCERSGEDPDYDPDADPEMLQPQRLRPQPDQAEGADDPAETGSE